MQAADAVVRAAIDVGSNTTHIVVARCTSDNLEILADEVKMIRTGESVTKAGELSQEIQNALTNTIRQYVELAKQHEARDILIVATEALREARNGEDFLTRLGQELGQKIQIISGATEAVLTYFGATYGLDIADDAGVADIGGGSTEIILSRQRHISWLTSFSIGSGRLHDEYLTSNPPSHQEMDQAREQINSELQKLHLPTYPQTFIVTGSSASALLQVAQQAFQLAEDTTILTQEDLLRCEGLLNGLPAKSLAQRYGLPLERARILPGGELLIYAIMQHLRCSEVRVNKHGLREGVLLAYTRFGDAWLEQPEIQGKFPQPQEAQKPPEEPTQEEPFTQFVQRALDQRMDKLFKWREKVLKRHEPEAIHKMRVASRRLRAIMDAYETLSNNKPYKKAYRQVKKAADVLGEVRDTDVLLKRIEDRLTGASNTERAGIQWLLKRLNVYHKNRTRDMDDLLQNFDAQDIQQKIQASIANHQDTQQSTEHTTDDQQNAQAPTQDTTDNQQGRPAKTIEDKEAVHG